MEPQLYLILLTLMMGMVGLSTHLERLILILVSYCVLSFVPVDQYCTVHVYTLYPCMYV